MNFLGNVITYVRRIVKTPSNASLSDDLIIDYINRFYINDVPAVMQLFDLKKTYQFQTCPTVDKYNMPLYSIQSEGTIQQQIGMYPVYQGFLGPARINGRMVPFQTEEKYFYGLWPKITQPLINVATGDGTRGPYIFTLPVLSGINPPIQNQNSFQGIIRGHVDISGIIATGTNQDPPLETSLNLLIPVTSVESAFFITSIDANGQSVVVQDSGQFLSNNVNCGLLMTKGNAPLGNTGLGTYSTTQNIVNYMTGNVYVTFPVAIPIGQSINVQCYLFNCGLPTAILYYNNKLVIRTPPDTQYNVELEAYLSPSAFMNSSDSIPFGYMSEYIARGAARKLLSDTGDIEQFQFYEPLFKEQETLVHIRSQRQFTETRTQTIYSHGYSYGNIGNFGGGYQ
jgi:hypothetical protein